MKTTGKKKKCNVVECVELTENEQHKYKTVETEYEIQSKAVRNDIWCYVVIRIFHRLYSDNTEKYVIYKDSDEKEHPGRPMRDELFESKTKKDCIERFNQIIQAYALDVFVENLHDCERLDIPKEFLETIAKLKKEALEIRNKTARTYYI